jgi:uncharacterized repeat protein (TIGR03843 family)
VLINNADRKGGHVLAMPGGHRYGVDHGVSFHVEDKLRTVLWGWAGDTLHPDDRVAVTALGERLRDPDRDPGLPTTGRGLAESLRELLDGDEVATLARRCLGLARRGRMPVPSGSWPSIPWPAF